MSNKESVIEELDLENDFEEGKMDSNEETEDVMQEENSVPDIGSEGWSDYVLSQLSDEEKIKEAPRTDGLFRIARTIFYNLKMDIRTVAPVNPSYAAVTCEIKVDDLRGGESVYVGSAEVSPENTDSPYNKYPLATAETRAMGRALKRLLCLTNVITAEETSKVADLTIPNVDENRTEGGITDTQIRFIDKMCKKLNVGVINTVKGVVGDHENINDLSHSEALKVNEVLDSWSKDSSSIEEGKFGDYESNWKSEFYVS